jgi:thiol-disulfide isomerase/thioredoxin
MASVLGALDAAPAAAWLNVPAPLTAAALRGRVVLADFWTYSCVNWLRTLPYVVAWHARYGGDGPDGLVVLGVHAPEFGFEHDVDNVRRAIAELDVTYPVVKDDDFAIWRAFENHYWPAAYLLDADGRLAFRHFGEGNYVEVERAIQAALGRDGEPLAAEEVVADGLAEAADWDALRTPETYVGAARGERRAAGAATAADLALNQWSLTGDWAIEDESVTLRGAPGAIAFRFQGRDLNLVLAPPPTGPTHLTVTLDGAPPGDAAGVDVAPSGAGAIAEPRMFQLIRARGPAVERTVEIAFAEPGVKAYVFTFG